MKIMNTGGFVPSMLASAVYPEMAAYPVESAYVKADGSFDGEAYSAAYDAWRSAIRVQRDRPAGCANGLAGFLADSIRQFLGGDSGENRVYSPLNVYMALAMLAELTDGESRAQVFSLLGADSVGAVRKQAKALWNANYRDDGLVSSVLASSLWLNESVGFLFDHTVSDFTPMTGDTEEVCVSQAKHAARVKIDEAGCEAAAYTVLAVRAMALMPPEEEIDFTLDRPFLFAVTGADGLPLFVGVVNTPVEN